MLLVTIDFHNASSAREMEHRLHLARKQMNVIRHHNVASDEPCRGLAPGAYNRVMNVQGRQNRSPLHSAGSHENNDCAVVPLSRRKMNGMFASSPRSARMDMLLHVLLPENRTCGSTSLRHENVIGHSTVVAIRFVISTGELKGGGSVRTGDSRFTAGKRAIDKGSELLP